jgi:plastocyanin
MHTPPGRSDRSRSPAHRLLGSALLLLTGLTGPCVAALLPLRVEDAGGKPAAGVVVIVEPAAITPAPPPAKVEIRQAGLRFVPAVTVVSAGSTVVFSNEDEFEHHVRGVGDFQRFELMIPEARPTSSKAAQRRPSATATLRHEDIVRLNCHLHGSMRGHIYVTRSPFYAVTDASGAVTLDGLPIGAATVRLWHPLELLPQAPTKIIVSELPTQTPVRLNFNVKGR